MYRPLLFSFALLLSALSLYGQTPQIAIPRIEQMPNQPAPYNLRDWRKVALRYDSFVYDRTKTGAYLPLVQLQPAGYNYPQQPAFGLHTYVGTNSPNGNEAINVLPSLVGAGLCGVDKTSQFGQNWLLMSQDFFSKNNGGQGIYLNNKGGGSGADWWYDLMPNVFFYQLCDLYPPAQGSEAANQFESVAERFLASVRALGGSETPWQKGNFDYRGFNFQTMQPNPNGVHEPEAAGAYAWVLYAAYRQTGNEAYRKGAEWALEFLHDWSSNPSYELQLPYGVLTAARMNAELGTRYDVGKLLNWCFERGALRGWGAIVGNWGGFDVSGLIGEANNAGNDYAFQLNGVQQAAALIPLVRYDKRYARAIGKWALNLTNATRLFYPGFLPDNYQDASIWSNANDPERIMGYEALRQKWQGLSPFSTGDALNGGWARTNLSLYSTGSIGYLGSMIEKTTVDKILKINVSKTDFYKKPAYPCYLFYNPHTTQQFVQLDVGAAPADLYDAISETFVLSNVKGNMWLKIPADGVLLLTICPAGGARSYSQNQMLIDGVTVDYGQTAQNWQRPPRIQALAAAQTQLAPGQQTTLFARVQAGDSPALKYYWSANTGMLQAMGVNGQWTAPAGIGPAAVQLIVEDGNGLRDTALLSLTVLAQINLPPVIDSLQKSAVYVAPGGTLQFKCFARDPNGDSLRYQWTFSAGAGATNSAATDWTAPNSEEIVDLKVTVRDDQGLEAEAGIKILVREFDAALGRIIAHYNFSGNANDLTVNQLHGIPFNTAYVPDLFGAPQRAIYFNGVNSRVTVNSQPVLNVQDGITVAAWFRANDLPAKENFLLSHGSWQNRWKISITPEKHLRWTVNTLSAVGDLDATDILTTDRFYHLTATYDGEMLALYLDGRLQSFKWLSGKIRTTNVAMLFGQMLPGNTEYNFKGVIDEVKIYDYALPPGAVSALYKDATTSLMSPHVAEMSALRLSPNPAHERIRLAWSGENMPASICILDAAGRVVFEQKTRAGNSLDIDINNWLPGTYFAIVRTARGIQRAVWIKS